MPYYKNPLFLAVLGGIVAGSAIALNLVLWTDDPIEPRPLPAVEAINNPVSDATPDVDQTANRQPEPALAPEPETEPVLEPVPEPSPEPVTGETESSDTQQETTAISPEAPIAEIPISEPPPVPPSFDVVRITPDGNAVIAGRAAPGSVVEILDGDRVIGSVSADGRGEWVFVPTVALQPGNRQLSLRAIGKDATSIESSQIVMVVVPERDSSEDPFAVAASRLGDEPSQVLQTPGNSGPAVLAIDAVDYNETGEFSLSGRATPDTLINIYLDNTYIGTAEANTDGRWSLIPETRVKPGQYDLRADQVDAKGNVQERINMPFIRDEVVHEMDAGSFYVVQPGNSLWRIARRIYGEGLSFTVIYKANKDQIGEPDLIYPGQIFTLPE